MHDYDFLIREFRTWIQRCDFLVIPFFDLAEKNPGNRVRIKLQCRVSGQIVSDYICASDRRDMQDFPGSFRQVLVAHRTIRRTEIDRLGQDLLLPAAGTDGLIIEPHGRIDLRVFVEPLRVNRIRKGRACSVDHHLRRSARA